MDPQWIGSIAAAVSALVGVLTLIVSYLRRRPPDRPEDEVTPTPSPHPARASRAGAFPPAWFGARLLYLGLGAAGATVAVALAVVALSTGGDGEDEVVAPLATATAEVGKPGVTVTAEGPTPTAAAPTTTPEPRPTVTPVPTDTPGAVENLVPNSSFEEGGRVPSGWRRVATLGTGLSTWDRSVGHSGTGSLAPSLEFVNADCVLVDESDYWETIEAIPVDTSRSYVLSWWHMNSQSGAFRGAPNGVGLTGYTSSGDRTGETMWGSGAVDTTPIGEWVFQSRTISSSDWQRHFDPRMVDAVRIYVSGNVAGGPSGTGLCEPGRMSVWVDDVYFGLLD